jgi:hypothetical protein
MSTPSILASFAKTLVRASWVTTNSRVETHSTFTAGPPQGAAGAAPWFVSALNAFPLPESLARALRIEICVEKSVVDPQLRSNTTARLWPSGEA